MTNFGNLFEYSRFETTDSGTIVYYDCSIIPTDMFYTHVELDPSDGTLTYYTNGVSRGKRWLTA
jgi:hypothetical protein